MRTAMGIKHEAAQALARAQEREAREKEHRVEVAGQWGWRVLSLICMLMLTTMNCDRSQHKRCHNREP